MNKLKKIGLTALAGSLVATSVFAGTMTVTGDASIEVQHNKGNKVLLMELVRSIVTVLKFQVIL